MGHVGCLFGCWVFDKGSSQVTTPYYCTQGFVLMPLVQMDKNH